MLNTINPTKTEAWKALENHYDELKKVHLREFFHDENRENTFSIHTDLLKFDYSKNRINQKTIDLLINLAQTKELSKAITSYFEGELINHTEKRAVLHTALRSNSNKEILVDNKNISPKIKTALRKISAFSNKLIYGKWKGYTNKNITDVVNIGIGGSDLGAQMVVEALNHYRNHLNIHFLANVDGDNADAILKKINPETTVFVIVSKTFTTQETLLNAETLKNWFLRKASIFDVSKHFLAVTSNPKQAEEFGIDKKCIFPMWDWVGGRFSLWSSVGLTISLAIGYKNFRALLDGAEKMDLHFKNSPFDKNIPVLMALLSIWYRNFFKTETEAVIPYSHHFSLFVPYLQQLFMESNGKTIDRNGNRVNYATGNVIWGSVGTNAQHAFMQLLHQGTQLVPADFILVEKANHNLNLHHEILTANFYAQTKALAFGKTPEETHLDMKSSNQENQINELLVYKVFEGNKPSNLFILNTLTPESLGYLIASYEHKVFVQGILWNINSFDQFGVELGKELANKYLKN